MWAADGSRGITNCMRADTGPGPRWPLGGAFSPPEYGEQRGSDPAYACVDCRGMQDREGQAA